MQPIMSDRSRSPWTRPRAAFRSPKVPTAAPSRWERSMGTSKAAARCGAAAPPPRSSAASACPAAPPSARRQRRPHPGPAPPPDHRHLAPPSWNPTPPPVAEATGSANHRLPPPPCRQWHAVPGGARPVPPGGRGLLLLCDHKDGENCGLLSDVHQLSKGLQGDRGGGGSSWLELDSEAEYVLGVAAGTSGEGVVQRLEESCVTRLSCTCPASETHRLHPKKRPVPWELWLFVNSEEVKNTSA